MANSTSPQSSHTIHAVLAVPSTQYTRRLQSEISSELPDFDRFLSIDPMVGTVLRKADRTT